MCLWAQPLCSKSVSLLPFVNVCACMNDGTYETEQRVLDLPEDFFQTSSSERNRFLTRWHCE